MAVKISITPCSVMSTSDRSRVLGKIKTRPVIVIQSFENVFFLFAFTWISFLWIDNLGDYIYSICGICRCPGKLEILKENLTEILIFDKAHTHPPDTYEVEVNKCLARMKHKAATTSINQLRFTVEKLEAWILKLDLRCH
ncbi:hypothetical protein QTP88_016585 [Uroleucon formosanum]